MFKFVVWVVGMCGALGLLLYAFAFDVWTVPADDPLLTASIAPTLSPGDVVISSRHPSVTQGYLMRCPDPEAPGRFVVARAIASAGETVSFDGETVAVDGHHTPSPRACDPAKMFVHDPRSDNDVELASAVEEFAEADFCILMSTINPKPSTKQKVEPGKWFLVSDDRHIHLDSRDYGGVDTRNCQHIVARVKGTTGIGLQILW